MVRSAVTQAGLPGASVTLAGTTIGVSADSVGHYRITDIPPGVYTVSFQSLGYERLTTPDIAVDGDRVIQLDAELQPIAIETAPVLVMGTYFRKAPDAPTSVFQLDADEVRRLPGSAGDLSRILSVLPSTARVSDRLNDLVVRGGSPFENGFNVDGIHIPNINHFPVQGSSAGPIGLLNTELVEDVRFYSGGFPVEFGDRLSSITDIRLREGRRDGFAAQTDVSVAGFGATLEGPLSSRGAWLISGRRSFFEVIEKPLDLEAVPEFEDIHAKISFDANQQNRFVLLNIYASSATEWSEEVSEDRGWAQYGDMAARQNTAGLVWRRLWGPTAHTETSVSYASIKYEDEWLFTRGDDTSRSNNSLEAALRVQSTSTIRPNDRHAVTVGGEFTRRIDDLEYHYDRIVGIIARPIPETRIDRRFHTTTAALFASHTWSPSPRVSATAGLRADHFCLTDRVLWAPRVSARVEPAPRLAVNAAFGVFHQNLPMFILAQSDRNRNLRAPTAIHSVLGFDYALSDAASLTVEFYDKEYHHFPLEPKNPRRFVIDDAVTLEGFVPYEDLVDNGRAWARGVEMLLQKRSGRGLNYL
ncbi:MAG TPA: TonB-dependent receptor, partial [Acidobacteriota bacterium]|nr:TonB-dependent receptor [Acidobacteriota bacterium]